MKEIRPIKNTWYDWIINSEPVRKSVGGFKDKIISLFKTNTPKQTVHGRGKKLSKKKKLKKNNQRYLETFQNTKRKKNKERNQKEKKKLITD